MIDVNKIKEWDKLIANMPVDGTALGHVMAPYQRAMSKMLSTIIALTNALIDAKQHRKCDDGDGECTGDCGGGDHPQCSHGGGD